MSISDVAEYIAERKTTTTCKEGLVIFKKYKIERKWGGLRTVFPDIPKADDEHHVLIMNFKGIHPSITDILTQNKPKIGDQAKTNELTNYLFIFVKIKPQLLSISSPDKGYQLGDGHTIHADIEVRYKINDAGKFWLNGDDPLALFQRAVINEAKEYFLNITSEYLVRRPGDSKGDLESYIREHQVEHSELKKVKGFLERDIKKRCSSSGIEIIEVYADVQLSRSLSEHLQRLHEDIYKPGGIIDSHYSLQKEALHRKQVDEAIHNDPTFHPFNLKQIIAALDIGLLENFYNLSWSEAMQKVHDEIRRKKNSYLSDHQKAKIEGIREFIQIAKEEEFEDTDIDRFRNKLFREMDNDQENDSPLFTDNQFLQLVMAQQIEADSAKKELPKGKQV
ncbi:MAG: hypothetical protein D3905_03110 [Candidatus Electrothrix sp. AS4_5]|nr:hypothetical protein [Candidatus Electrothrix gigas]